MWHFSTLQGKSYGVERHFQQYFNNIMAVRFIGGGNQSMRRKLPTYRKSLTTFITYNCIELHWVHR